MNKIYLKKNTHHPILKVLFMASFLFFMVSQVDKLYLNLFKNIGLLCILMSFMYASYVNRKIYLNSITKVNFIIIAIFSIIYIPLKISINMNYLLDIYIYMVISYLILLASFQVSFIWDREEIINIIKYIGIIIVIISCFIFVKNYLGKDFVNQTYIYSEKNSTATLLAAGIGILYFTHKGKKIKFNILIIILTFIMFFFKSRASSIGFCFSIVIMFFCKKQNKITRKKILYFLIGILLALILCIIYSDNIINWIQIIFLNNLSLNDASLNSVSGARISMFKYFFDAVANKPIFGVGEIYIESFPLAIMASYGFIGSTLVFALLAYIFQYLYKLYKNNKENPLYKLVIFLLLLYYFNSFFEMLAPFGPGTKCLPLWCIIGLALNKKMSTKYPVNNKI